MKPKAVGILNGSGGMAIGFEQAGFDTIAVIEKDDQYALSYRLNRPTVPHHVLDPYDDEAWEGLAAELAVEEPTLVYGHPPCQGLSGMNAGATGDPDSPKNRLTPLFVKTALQMKPQFAIYENIPRMLNMGRAIVERCRKIAEGAGYHMTIHKHMVYDFDVCQNRRRVLFTFEKKPMLWPSHPTLEPRERPTVWDAISDLADMEPDVEGVEQEYVGPPQTPYQERMRNPEGSTWNHKLIELPARYQHIEQGRSWRSLPDELMSDKERERVEKGGGFHAVELYRLRQNGVAPTVTGAFNKMHPTQCRHITVREAARLMGFPDWWQWRFSENFQQIAAGVCPPVAEWFGRAFMAELEGKILEAPMGRLF